MKFTTLCDKGRVYLDHNATTPLATSLAEQVPNWLTHWGNPSSIHQSGRGPKALLRQAREQVARMINSSPLEIVFTSSGTEANNFALNGVIEYLHKMKIMEKKFGSIVTPRSICNRILVSSVEHPSVCRTAEALQSRGVEVDILPVNRKGEIDLQIFDNMLSENTALVSAMLANNETGVIFPIKKMAEIAHRKGILFHSDCVQALGKIALDIKDLGVDLASFSGHKFYSLKGAGFLYVRKGLSIESLIHGGGQERHRRGGTENLLAIVALGAQCALRDQVAPRALEMANLRDHLEVRIKNEISGVSITTDISDRLPNTSSLIIAGVDGETLLMNLDMRGFSVSTGAACSSGSPEPSPVLLAMGLSRAEAQSSLRVGIGWESTQAELDLFVDTLKEVVLHLRSFNRFERESHVSL